MFNLREIRAEVEKSGIAKTANFSVDIHLEGADTQSMTFRTSSVQIPGRNIQTMPLEIYGAPQMIPYRADYEPVQMNIMLSEDLREKIFFERWQDKAIGKHRTVGASKSRHVDFDLGYYDSIHGTVNIRQYDNKGNQIFRCELREAFPSFIGGLDGDWATSELHMLNVTMMYHHYIDEFTGE